jgi:hypothetical protein
MPAPPLIEAIVNLMQRRRETGPYRADLQPDRARGGLPTGEDVGLVAADLDAALALRALARRGPDEACLLPRRLTALGLDPDEIARLEPAVFRGLYWRCTMCESKGECAVDLAGDVGHPAWPDRSDAWRSYCPNAATFRALGDIPWLDEPKR